MYIWRAEKIIRLKKRYRKREGNEFEDKGHRK